MLTKQQIKVRLAFTTDLQLAELFDISPSAVSQWPESAPIPRQRWLQLRYELRPDVAWDDQKVA